MEKGLIDMSHGSGGKEMLELIRGYGFSNRGKWENFDNDSATLGIGDNLFLVFTTDSFVVTPLFFPGGNIGHIAACGTINDLAVIGAKPLGLSVAFVIEEGFPRQDLDEIVASINKVSVETRIPVVTGDTKVMEKGKLDGIVINTSGVGIASSDELLAKRVNPGDKLIVSGGLAEHAVALLSKRFDYKSNVVSDSKPLTEEINAVRSLVSVARDITRGGIAAVLNELCERHGVGMLLDEESIPAKPQVRKVAEMLGINLYELASEGRFVCIAPAENAGQVASLLQQFNPDAAIIGEITRNSKVIIQTLLGRRILQPPTGKIVPRIC
jgi:hydrogenase expression/formation protein HypE